MLFRQILGKEVISILNACLENNFKNKQDIDKANGYCRKSERNCKNKRHHSNNSYFEESKHDEEIDKGEYIEIPMLEEKINEILLNIYKLYLYNQKIENFEIDRLYVRSFLNKD